MAAGKSDIEKYGSGDIETFTTPNFSAALAYRGQWLFIASDTGLLKSTLDRVEGQPQPDSLAEQPAFKNCMAHMPDAPDNVMFLRPGLLADKAATLAMMLNPTSDAKGMEGLKKIDAVSLALKMDGAVTRDAAFVIQPMPPGADAPLARDSLKISTPDTIVATSERIESLGDIKMPDGKSDPTGMLQLLESYMQAFTDQGLDEKQLVQAFGPESGVVVNWPAGEMIPTPLVMADVRDPAKARKFLDTLTTLPLAAGVNFAHTDAGGIAYYSLPQTGLGIMPLQVTLGLTKKGLIGALSTDAVKDAAARWDAGTVGLDGTDSFKNAVALVQEPTMSFAYVDTKAIFERVYGMFRGVASMGFVPHLSDYVDIAKLPAPEVISKHLSPLVWSASAKDGGLLAESAGPVSAMQGIMGAAVIVGAAAVPVIEAEMRGQSVTIPGLSGLGIGPGSGVGGGMGNLFGNPLSPGGSAVPSVPVPSASPSAPSPSASTSGTVP